MIHTRENATTGDRHVALQFHPLYVGIRRWMQERRQVWEVRHV